MRQAPQPGPALVVRHTGQVFPLTQVPISIGRSANNTIILADPLVSQQHAAVDWQAGSFVVRDLGSTNGTYVNEHRISGASPLRDGFVLRVGNTLFDVHLPAVAAGAAPVAPAEEVLDGAYPTEPATGRSTLPLILALLAGGFVVVCLITAGILLLLDRRGGPPGATATPSQTAIAGPTTPVLTPSPEPPTPTPSITPPVETPTITATATLTPTATPTPTQVPPPEIEFFRANPARIAAGGCSELEWGTVTNAMAAVLDQGIGGVGTPGSIEVCPPATTTYTLTAIGPGGKVTATATVTVLAGQPDLTIDAITFVPSAPVAGRDVQVLVSLRNAGTAAAGPFEWAWQPGSEAPLGGQVAGGLAAGARADVSVTWRPTSPSDDLPTVALVDSSNRVVESNEDNNLLRANVQVAPGGATTVTLKAQASLDGYGIGGLEVYNAQEIRVGNLDTGSGEVVYRGFLSFDLSGIPTGAIIQEVRLRFYQVEVVGDPYGKLAPLVAAHVDYGLELDPADFYAADMGSAILNAVALPGEWTVAAGEPFAGWIAQDLAAGRARFQVRLQFASEIDDGATPDYGRIESGNNSLGTGNLPELTITFLP